MLVLVRLQQVLVTHEAALGGTDSQNTGHDAEGHAVLVHGGILHAADAGHQRCIELGHGEDVVHLLLGEAQNTAHTGGNANSAEGAAGVCVLIVIHDGGTDADGGLIGHQHGGEELITAQVVLIGSCQHGAHEGSTGMGAGHVVTVVNIICVGGVTHGGGGTQEVELLVRADNGDLACAEDGLRQLQTGLELAAAAADDQSAHQVNETALHALLDFLGNVLPLGIQNEVFQLVSSFKMHNDPLLLSCGAASIRRQMRILWGLPNRSQ